MTESAPPVSEIQPAEALALAGDVPRGSEMMTTTQVQTPAHASPPSVVLDTAGTPFDPAVHSVDEIGNPKKTAKGTWFRKPGNGARKAAGKPPTGNIGSPPPNKPAKAPEKKPEPGEPSQFVRPAAPPVTPTPGELDGADAEPAPELPPLTDEQAAITAESLINGSLGLAQMAGGDHWAPTAEESRVLKASVARVWKAHNLPPLGPAVELVMLLISFIFSGKDRRGDMQRLWQWASGKRALPAPDQSR